jgi:hypothetical protein
VVILHIGVDDKTRTCDGRDCDVKAAGGTAVCPARPLKLMSCWVCATLSDATKRRNATTHSQIESTNSSFYIVHKYMRKSRVVVKIGSHLW